jgi:hypothetical protein
MRYRKDILVSIYGRVLSLEFKPDKHSPEFKDRQRLYAMKQVLLRSAAREYREKWVSNAYVTEAKRQLEHEHDDDDDDDNSPRSIETFTLTRQLKPARWCR